MAEKKEIYSDTIVVTDAILDWPHLWEMHTPEGSSKPSYSCAVLISEADAQRVYQAAQKVATERFVNGEMNLQKFKWPVMRASEKQNNDGSFPYRDNPRTANLWLMNASDSKDRPAVVDQNRQDILDKGEIYAGCIVAIGFQVGTYNTAGNIGVRCGLKAIMKQGDGEHLATAGEGSGVNVDALFGNVKPHAQAPAAGPFPGGAPASQGQTTPFGQPTQAPAPGMPAAPFGQPADKPPFL